MVKNVTGQPVSGNNLYGREFDLGELWKDLEAGANILMAAPRRVGKTSIMLEVERSPRPNWIVFYSDLEGGASAADFLAEIIAKLAKHADYKTWIENLPFSANVAGVFKKLSGSVEFEGIRVEVKNALGAGWQDDARQLEERLEALPNKNKVIFILDEFPILLAHILEGENGKAETEALLTWFRRIRQNKKVAGRICFLVGGSIGLEGVLRKHGLSAHVNDFKAFRIGAWTPEIAREFLIEVGKSEGFVIPDDSITRILESLGEAVPYHVQLFFDALRSECRGDIKKLTAELIDKVFIEHLAGPSGTAHLDHYATRLDTMLDEDEVALARTLLAEASRSKNGLDETAMATIAKGKDDLFTKVLRQLREDKYLIMKPDGKGVYFYSNLVRLWWKNNEAGWSAAA